MDYIRYDRIKKWEMTSPFMLGFNKNHNPFVAIKMVTHEKEIRVEVLSSDNGVWIGSGSTNPHVLVGDPGMLNENTIAKIQTLRAKAEISYVCGYGLNCPDSLGTATLWDDSQAGNL